MRKGFLSSQVPALPLQGLQGCVPHRRAGRSWSIFTWNGAWGTPPILPGFEKLDSVALFEQFYQKIKGTELSAEAKQIVTEIMMGGKENVA